MSEWSRLDAEGVCARVACLPGSDQVCGPRGVHDLVSRFARRSSRHRGLLIGEAQAGELALDEREVPDLDQRIVACAGEPAILLVENQIEQHPAVAR
jgi:hypothetical protein